jgi:uncharacterized membrane protein YphA (DoxX/SURF4 family)
MGWRFDRFDRRTAAWARRWGTWALRIALAVVFVWFGVLKPLGLSPAEAMVLRTVEFMPFFPPRTWLSVIGWWEVAIGLAFLFQHTLRIAIALLALQMVGTFLPLFVMTDVTWQPGRIALAPTMVGQYVIKNLLILGAAMVVGGTVREKRGPRTTRAW